VWRRESLIPSPLATTLTNISEGGYMQVQLLVERMGQDEYNAKIAGASYKFRRNDHGHMVAEITDEGIIKRVSDPRNGSFAPYTPPEPKVETAPDKDPETFPCPVCGKSFDTVGKVNSHMGGAHRKG